MPICLKSKKPQFESFGRFPPKIKKILLSALANIPRDCFFKKDGSPRNRGLKGIDEHIYNYLIEKGVPAEKEWGDDALGKHTVDIALPKNGVLIEVEKGKLPRLEKDLLKMLVLSYNSPSEWKYAVFIVPFSHIHLKLEGEDTPYYYLTKRLLPLIEEFVICNSSLRGVSVFGYHDPRG